MKTSVSTIGSGIVVDGATVAQEAFRQLAESLYAVTKEAAVRAAESLPGLDKSFDQKVLVNIGGQATGPMGSFATEKWCDDVRQYHELHINVGHYTNAGSQLSGHAARVMETILHELVHLYASERGIKDTSGRKNRYHNQNFARLASTIGLNVFNTQKSHLGFAAAGLNNSAQCRYADLTARIEVALRLSSTPTVDENPVPSTTAVSTGEEEATSHSKYIFASCSCRDPRGRKRTIRIASGWWIPDAFGCAICRAFFVESRPKTAKDQVPA